MAFLFFLLAGFIGFASGQQSDVCSQVFLMSQYCSSQGGNGTGEGGQAVTYKVFEEKMNVKFQEIEARLIRKFGEPPEVNYTAVEETITKRFKGVESRVIQQLGEPPKVNYTAIDISINERFQRLEARVNGDGDQGTSIVDYSLIQGSIDAKFRALQLHIDSKFASLINNTEEYQKALEEMNRRINISDCRDVKLEDAKLCNATGGVFDIYRGLKKYEVFCDTYTDHGGWTVFQRRRDGSTNFNRTYDEYVNGFGDRAGEFWLGLKRIHELLQGGDHELRIDVMDSNGFVRFAKFGLFHLSGKVRNYELLIKSYSGDLPNSLINNNNDRFSINHLGTFQAGNRYCAVAQTLLGGWWYTSGCEPTNLNGAYADASSFYWKGFANIVSSEMKFRRLVEDED